VFGLVTPIETLSLILLLAGLWTLVGAAVMRGGEEISLRRGYLATGTLLVVAAGVAYLWR